MSQHLVFDPCQYEEGKVLLNNVLSDPDCNFFNDVNLSNKNSYVCESELSSFGADGSFSIMHINCRSLLQKCTQLGTLLNRTTVSVVALTETWLNEYTKDSVHLSGYSFVACCRKHKLGGGVGFLVANGIDYKVIDIPLQVDNDVIECQFIDVLLNGKRVLIGSIYRPPNTKIEDFNDDLEKILTCNVLHRYKHMFLAGDFNIDLLKVDSHQATKQFFDLLTSHYLLPTIYRPTRITETNATLIDNIFTSAYSECEKSAIICSDLSDHLPVIVSCYQTPKMDKNITKYKRCYSPDAIKNFKDLLVDINWEDITESCRNKDVNNAYAMFHKKYLEIYNICFPIQKIIFSGKKCPKQPWITPALIKSCNVKSKLYKKYQMNPSTVNKTKFCTYRNKLKSLLKIAEKSYYSDLFMKCRGDLTKTWKNIKMIIHGSTVSKLPTEFTYNNNSVSGTKNIAETFNQYFLNVGVKLADKIKPSTVKYNTFLPGEYMNSLYFYPTEPCEVISTCSLLKNKSSSGYDKIVSWVAKTTISTVAEPLAEIINCSLETGMVPDELKIAKVIPVYKAGAKNEFSNYRPISILPFFSKIFEKIVYARLINYLNKLDILTPSQYGFRKKSSTYMALVDICDQITNSIDNRDYCAGVFIDLSKAFDTIDHTILLTKLQHYGIRGVALDWFKSYLTNRAQFVSIESVNSDNGDITCGVPQGSILGPLLFLIYINDIYCSSSVLKFILFADDTNLFYSSKSISDLQHVLNHEMAALSDWFKANKLSLNIDKTSYILFCANNARRIPEPSFELYIESIKVKRVESCKFLGVYLDEKMTWKTHIDQITSKMSKSIGIISRTKHILPKYVLHTLYYTMIFPYLHYCNIVWASTYPSRLEKIIVLQKRIIRIISLCNYREHTSNLFKELHILKFPDITFLQTALFMFRVHNKLLPSHLINTFYQNNEIHHYCTRSSYNYHLELVNTNIKQFSITYKGPVLWNSIPVSIRSLKNINQFKQHIIDTLLKKY